jgi:Ca-activated chloride channel homolog
MKVFISSIFIFLFAVSIFAQAQGEITVPTTYLRKSPSPNAERIQTLKKGEKIILEKVQDTDGWYYVSVAGGNVKGWVNGNTFLTTLAPEAKTTTNQTSPDQTRDPDASQVLDEDEVLRIETEEINLSVRVVDANNRPVANLRESHFKVYEDNVVQPITYLTTTEVPIINALVVDNSRSLRTQLQTVIEAGKILVGANHPQDESTVVRFVSADKIEVVRDFTTNKKLLEDALNNLFIEGGQTAIIDAIYLTAQRLDQYHNSGKKDDVRRRALIVVSDGDDRSSKYNEQQLFDLLRESDVQVYAVGFVNGLSATVAPNEQKSRQERARAFLTRLAEETGGRVYFPDSTDELLKIARDISTDLRTQYLITYAPTNETRDRSFRNIKVEVAPGANNEKRTAITRTGRTAAPDGKPAAPGNQRKP